MYNFHDKIFLTHIREERYISAKMNLNSHHEGDSNVVHFKVDTVKESLHHNVNHMRQLSTFSIQATR